MQSKRFLVILAAILFVLPATGIVNAEEAEVPAEQVSENTNTINDTDTDNNVEQTEALACQAPVEADVFAPDQPAVYTNKCGSCSVSGCRGVTRGTYCGGGKYCIPTDTLFCPGTDDWDCQCAKYYN